MKRALLVGIDEYDNFTGLEGCVNDVIALQPLLARHETADPNFDCQTFTSNADRVTRDSFLALVKELLGPGADVALLYFAGHGDKRKNDVVLVTQDGTNETPGVGLSEILTLVEASSVNEVIIVLDCCFAGGAGGVPQLGPSGSLLREGVSILAASRKDQTAAESPDGRGVFSTYFCGAVDEGAADVLGKVTVAGIYAYLSESFGPWDQRPTFKANVDRLHELRLCKPAVPLDELRRLPEFFPAPDYDFPLDRSYEDTEEPRDEEHEAIFKILQRCRAAKLVEPVGSEHMYWAAMEEKSCILTPLGQHYWRMAKQDRI